MKKNILTKRNSSKSDSEILPPQLAPIADDLSLHSDSTMATANGKIDIEDVLEAQELTPSKRNAKEEVEENDESDAENDADDGEEQAEEAERKKTDEVAEPEATADKAPEQEPDSSTVSPQKTTTELEQVATPPTKAATSEEEVFEDKNDDDSDVEVRIIDDDEASTSSASTQPETPEKDEFVDEDDCDLQVRGSPSPKKKSVKVNLEDVELGKASKKKKRASSSKKSGKKDSSKKSSKKNSSDKKKSSSKKKQSSRNNRRRFRCKMAVCCILSLFLMACIAILGYTLHAVRNDQEPSFFGIDIAAKFQEWFNRENGDSDTDSSTSSNTPPKPSLKADPELMAMVRDSLLMATGAATGSATQVPGMMDISTVLDVPNSIQYAVVAWLANDPFVLNYSANKLLQRYVLGCFYWSLQDIDMNNKQVLNTWMTYEDECDLWHTTGEGLCDAEGNVVSLHLENVGLKGTLAPELALLSNSLKMLYLTENKVKGSLPGALGQLTNLKRLQLSRNSMTGELPKSLGNLQSLEVLSLGHNSFSGSIPPQITKLTNLIELNLSNNQFTGEIPAGVLDLNALSILRLEENSMGGAIPEAMCNRTSTATNEALEMTVDCEEVQCSCCKDCSGLSLVGDDEEETAATIASSPTTAPTVDPLAYPIAQTVPANSDCYAIQTGFGCYNTQFAIDFESSVCSSEAAADMVAVFAGALSGGVGTQRPLTDAVLWATSCSLAECDGVVSEGMIYYRNMIPERLKAAASWPLATGSYVLAVIQVDASGMATILAESEPFSVAEQCPE